MAAGNNKNIDNLMNKINIETGRSDAEEILRYAMNLLLLFQNPQ